MSDSSTYDQVTEDAEKTAKKHMKSVTDAVNKAHVSGEESIHNNIRLGVALLEARQALGANFYEIIDSKIIHKKKMQRYIKMVTHKDCDDQLAKKPHLDDKKNLKVDTRVVALLGHGFSQYQIPSMGKITSMRYLSDEDFETVLGGDYEPLEDSIKERYKKTDAGIMKEELRENFKKHYSDKVVDELMEQGKIALLNDLYTTVKDKDDAVSSVTTLEERIIELEVQLENANKEIDTLKSNQEVRDQTLFETGVIKKKKRA